MRATCDGEVGGGLEGKQSQEWGWRSSKAQARSRFRVVRASPGHRSSDWLRFCRSSPPTAPHVGAEQPRQRCAVGTLLSCELPRFHSPFTPSHNGTDKEAYRSGRSGRDCAAAIAEELSCQPTFITCFRSREREHCTQCAILMLLTGILISYRSRRMLSLSSHTVSLLHLAHPNRRTLPHRSPCSWDGLACRASASLHLSSVGTVSAAQEAVHPQEIKMSRRWRWI